MENGKRENVCHSSLQVLDSSFVSLSQLPGRKVGQFDRKGKIIVQIHHILAIQKKKTILTLYLKFTKSSYDLNIYGRNFHLILNFSGKSIRKYQLRDGLSLALLFIGGLFISSPTSPSFPRLVLEAKFGDAHCHGKCIIFQSKRAAVKQTKAEAKRQKS